MSILEKMRSSTDSTAMQIVLMIIIVAMFFWYSPTTGDTSRTVVTVNGTQIRDTEYFPKYREAYARAQQRGMTSDQEEQLQFRVKEELAREEVLRQIATSMGHTASDKDIRTVIQNDYRFFHPDTNAFDEEIYKDYRKSRSVQELEKGFETKVLINKLRWSVVMSADLPEERVREQYVERDTKVDIQYVRVDPSAVQDTIQIDAADLTSWMAENTAAIQDRYDKDFKRFYDFPERVTLDVIRLIKEAGGPSDEELRTKLNALRTSATDGEPFVDLAKKWSEDDSAVDGGRLLQRRLPTLTQNERDALAGLVPGGITEVLDTEGSLYFYRLDSRLPAETISLEAASKDISDALIREERASQQATTMANTLLEEWKSTSEMPNEMIGTMGLEMDQTGLLNRQDRKMGGPPADMIEASLAASEGALLEQVFVDVQSEREVRYVGRVSKLQNADMENYAANKDRLYESVLFQLREAMWQMWVDEQVAGATILVQ
jgi:hypothetical protein